MIGPLPALVTAQPEAELDPLPLPLPGPEHEPEAFTLEMGDGDVTSRQTFSRNRRLEGEIRAVLAELLRLSVKDPRLDGVTVSAIQLSADRTQARVFYSLIGDDERERQAADGFAAAAAFLRRELGQRMRLRTVPALEFHRDTSYEYGDRIERLLDRIQGGAPAAGDADDDAGTEEP